MGFTLWSTSSWVLWAVFWLISSVPNEYYRDFLWPWLAEFFCGRWLAPNIDRLIRSKRCEVADQAGCRTAVCVRQLARSPHLDRRRRRGKVVVVDLTVGGLEKVHQLQEKWIYCTLSHVPEKSWHTLLFLILLQLQVPRVSSYELVQGVWHSSFPITSLMPHLVFLSYPEVMGSNPEATQDFFRSKNLQER